MAGGGEEFAQADPVEQPAAHGDAERETGLGIRVRVVEPVDTPRAVGRDFLYFFRIDPAQARHGVRIEVALIDRAAAHPVEDIAEIQALPEGTEVLTADGAGRVEVIRVKQAVVVAEFMDDDTDNKIIGGLVDPLVTSAD